jgi:hypothetical protein
VPSITSDLYDAEQAGELPEKAVAASLGCGNPTALAELKPGETVLDLSSERVFAGRAQRPEQYSRSARTYPDRNEVYLSDNIQPCGEAVY